MTDRADIVVVGGGPVGAVFAAQTAAHGFRVVSIDPRAPGTKATDVRPIALSYGSRLILERLGIWGEMQPATAIEKIHVSQRGAFGRAMLTAAEARVPALGYVTDYAGIVAVTDTAVSAAGVQVIRGARVISIDGGADAPRVRYETAEGVREYAAGLAVIAEGGALHSVGAVDVREYGQAAITARLHTSRAHGNVAYERFTPDGPIALLPYGAEYALVWTTRAEHANALVTSSTDNFLAMLQHHFGERAGRFTSVSVRAAHPLSLRVAREGALQRVVAIGNAAQALHPVAGQGLNLGLRDAWELANEVTARGMGERTASSFRTRRRWDRSSGIAFTDSLVSIFSNDSTPLALARGAALALVDNVPSVKNFLMRRMMFGTRG
jgi:2-octaprenyl-6-methoxyphenol hydroxylase